MKNSPLSAALVALLVGCGVAALVGGNALPLSGARELPAKNLVADATPARLGFRSVAPCDGSPQMQLSVSAADLRGWEPFAPSHHAAAFAGLFQP